MRICERKKKSWIAKRINVEVMEEAGLPRSVVNRIRKQQTTFVGHITEKKRIGTPYDHRENGGETRKRKTEGTNDRQSCRMDGHR